MTKNKDFKVDVTNANTLEQFIRESLDTMFNDLLDQITKHDYPNIPKGAYIGSQLNGFYEETRFDIAIKLTRVDSSANQFVISKLNDLAKEENFLE